MQRRHAPIKEIGVWLKRVVQGYLNYHAIPGNLKKLGMFRAEVCRAWMRAIRRRRQRSRMTWERFQKIIAFYILHPQGSNTTSLSQPALRVMTRGKSRMR
jgi:hypothetical protein